MKNGIAHDDNHAIFLTAIPHHDFTYCMTCSAAGLREDMVRIFESAWICRACDAEIRRRQQLERRAGMKPYPIRKRSPEPQQVAFRRHFEKVGKDKFYQRAEWVLAALFVLLFFGGLGMSVYDAVRHGTATNGIRQTYERVQRTWQF